MDVFDKLTKPLGPRRIGTADQQRAAKPAAHQRQTIQTVLEHAVQQEQLGADSRRPVSTLGAQSHVEEFGHGPLVRCQISRDKKCVVVDVLRTFARWTLDFALPPRCPGCGAIVDEVHSFCPECWKQVEFLGSGGCRTCGLPLHATNIDECAVCLAAPPRIARTRAAVAYDDLSRGLAIRLKYGRKVAIARTMARYMAPLVDSVEGDRILVPVPLHRSRLWSRGFNQSALIAHELSRRLLIDTELFALRRIRRTPPLKGMSLLQRRRAVAGAFSVADPARVEGKSVILVDDVLTTGSTAEACARTLKRAGAVQVELISWARVVKPSQFMR